MDGQGGLKMTASGWDEYANIVFGVFGAAGSLHITKADGAADGQSTSQRVLASPTQAPIATLLNSLTCAFSWLQCRFPARLTPSTCQVAKHFVQFMRNFYDVFPQFRNIDVRSWFLLSCPLTGSQLEPAVTPVRRSQCIERSHSVEIRRITHSVYM